MTVGDAVRQDGRCLFIHEQQQYDLAVGCLVEGHTWEALRDAVDRVRAYDPLSVLPPARVGGLALA